MRKYLYHLLAVFCLISACKSGASWHEPELDDHHEIIGFYNVENLFDTIADSQINDSEFLPGSRLDWNSEKYLKKLDQLATVIEKMGHPVVMGLSEIENRQVLEDLVAQPALKDAEYEIAHINSSDPRGIDCALLYQKGHFLVDSQYLVRAYNKGGSNPGRQQLIVEGRWQNGKATTFAVNHWPSRRGGVDQSEHKRISAARNLFITLFERHDLDEDYIIIMGDFNDEPSNTSVLKTLNAGPESAKDYQFVNLSFPEFTAGKGSYNYRGNWNMLDQIIVSKPFTHCGDGFCMQDAKVYRAPDLLFRHPKFGLSPNRTAGGPNYYGGYSDHLPVYAPIQFQTASNTEM